MKLWRYKPHELPWAVFRMVKWRWPRERLLLTVPCEAEWPTVRADWSTVAGEWTAEDVRSPSSSQNNAAAGESYVEEGALGVTDARIVFKNLDRPGTPCRLAAWTFACLSAVGVLAPDAAALAPGAAVLALVCWAAGRVVDALGIGGGSLERGRIVDVDPVSSRIHGVDPWGVHYRLRLTEADLERVARLLAA